MEDMKCPYEERCKERFTEKEMSDFREKCDCINCALCDYYWLFYDEQCLKKMP